MLTDEFRKESTDLIGRLKEHLPIILQERPVLLAYLYGSAAEGYTHPFSDVDVALVLDPHCELNEYQQFKMTLAIAEEIEQQSGVQETDVRVINGAPLQVQGQVLSRGILLYSKDEDFRVEYEVQTRKRYFDFQPVLAMMREAYFARLEGELKEKHLL